MSSHSHKLLILCIVHKGESCGFYEPVSFRQRPGKPRNAQKDSSEIKNVRQLGISLLVKKTVLRLRSSY